MIIKKVRKVNKKKSKKGVNFTEPNGIRVEGYMGDTRKRKNNRRRRLGNR